MFYIHADSPQIPSTSKANLGIHLPNMKVTILLLATLTGLGLSVPLTDANADENLEKRVVTTECRLACSRTCIATTFICALVSDKGSFVGCLTHSALTRGDCRAVRPVPTLSRALPTVRPSRMRVSVTV